MSFAQITISLHFTPDISTFFFQRLQSYHFILNYRAIRHKKQQIVPDICLHCHYAAHPLFHTALSLFLLKPDRFVAGTPFRWRAQKYTDYPKSQQEKTFSSA
ncbi:MAG: hypothetical protein IJ551_05125 [Prevotella sp.]|nr:hypothetical protein [Prevotella sp.]